MRIKQERLSLLKYIYHCPNPGVGDLTTKLCPTVEAIDTKKMKMSNARGYARPPPGQGKHW